MIDFDVVTGPNPSEKREKEKAAQDSDRTAAQKETRPGSPRPEQTPPRRGN